MDTKRKAVRFNSKSPSPYLKDKVGLLLGPDVVINGQKVYSGLDVADLGCGKGRNSEFMASMGCRVASYDMIGDYGIECNLGFDTIPLRDKSCDVVLMNYVLMFLSPHEISHVIKEVKRISRDGCKVMVEMYEAKSGNMKDIKAVREWIGHVKDMLGWEVIDEGRDKCRFIAVKKGGIQDDDTIRG